MSDTKLAPATCEACGAPLDQPSTGRPRRYCSPSCRVYAHRNRADRHGMHFVKGKGYAWVTVSTWESAQRKRRADRERAEAEAEGTKVCAREGRHDWRYGGNYGAWPTECKRCGLRLRMTRTVSYPDAARAADRALAEGKAAGQRVSLHAAHRDVQHVTKLMRLRRKCPLFIPSIVRTSTTTETKECLNDCLP